MFSKTLKILLFCCGLMSFAIHGNAEDAENAEEDLAAPKAIYLDLKPAFVTNFGSNGGKKLSYLKVDVSVRAKTQPAIDLVTTHAALVRHQLVMLLSRQTDVSLSGPGQEQIRLEALKLVQAALEVETGAAQIDDVLFTSFVVQR